MKPRFLTGDTVAYDSPAAAKPAAPGTEMTVVKVIPNGTKFGNGFTNITGKTIYACRLPSGGQSLFGEDQLKGVSSISDRLKEKSDTYRKAEAEYRDALHRHIRSLIGAITGNAAKVDINDVKRSLDAVCKYCTPKDYPGNYRLTAFGYDKQNNLHAEAEDIDGDGEWEFSGYDFTVEELEEIDTLLENVLELIGTGEFACDDKGNVTDITEN